MGCGGGNITDGVFTITHEQLRDMADVLGVNSDHDIRYLVFIGNDEPLLPANPPDGFLWLDEDAIDTDDDHSNFLLQDGSRRMEEDFLPDLTANDRDLGGTSFQWRDLWLSRELIVVSDSSGIKLGADSDFTIVYNNTDTVYNISTSGNHSFTGGNMDTSTVGRHRNVTRITDADSPYTVLITDHVIFGDTDGGVIIINLPAIIAKERNLKTVNTGSSNNDITLTPNGSDNLFGINSSVTIFDTESFIIDSESTEGWF